MLEEEKKYDFVGFPKIFRVSRNCIITEKIDGTNAQIFIDEDCKPITLKSGRVVPFLCGSRTRWIFPESDNAGFAKWAYNNINELLKLGSGHHFGEWWGQGIQRTYDLKEKRFSLFNTLLWKDELIRPKCCNIVPVLYEGIFNTTSIEECINILRKNGSIAAPGFMKPEGIVCYHTQGNFSLKKTLEKDEEHKSQMKG